MECKLVLEVFRFDCKTDYLPYYKKGVLKIDIQKTVADMLRLIKDDEKSFEYPIGANAAIKINGKSLFTDMKIEEVKDVFGKELQLDPLNSKRSEKDLHINTEDFDAKFDILDAFVDASDRKVFKSYIREHYASPIVNMEDEFIGDGLFAFAYDMVVKYPERRTKILESIAKKDSGIWLHVNISNRLYPQESELERKIVYLKNAILSDDDIVDAFVDAQRNISRGL
jgi:succinate dehydrogenase/fumarate reductase-like Fe-S protein